LKDVRATPSVRDTGAREEGRVCLAVIAVANDAGCGDSRNAERNTAQAATSTTERTVGRQEFRQNPTRPSLGHGRPDLPQGETCSTRERRALRGALLDYERPPSLPSSRIRFLARPKGLEPLTGGLETRCSIRLSYERVQSDSRSLTPGLASGAGIFSIADRVVKLLWRLRAAGANVARKSRKTPGSVRGGGDVV
jgi:hypothetical protein